MLAIDPSGSVLQGVGGPDPGDQLVHHELHLEVGTRSEREQTHVVLVPVNDTMSPRHLFYRSVYEGEDTRIRCTISTTIGVAARHGKKAYA